MTTQTNKSIFMVESGLVFICESYTETDDAYHLDQANVIRVWGTTKGIGQIALQGPTSDTIFDPCGNPTVPKGKVLVIIPCVV